MKRGLGFILVVAGLLTLLTTPALAKTTLVYGTTEKIKDLDPATSYEFHTAEIFGNVYPTLLTPIPGSTKVGPGLAESYSVSTDGIEYTFRLRQGLKFPDGEPLNAKVVKYSIDRVFALKGPISFLVTGYVDRVEVVSEYEVKFILKKPAAIFPSLVTISCYAPVSPKQYSADKTAVKLNELPAKKMAGFGAYQVVSFKRDEELVLIANPNSYRDKPKIDQIVILYFVDATTMRLAFEKGDIDIAFKSLNPSDVDDLNKTGKFRNVAVNSPMIRYLCFLTDTAPFNDKVIRQAVGAAIDRKSLLDKVYLGQNSPLYSMVPEGMWTHTPAFKKKWGDGNIDKTRELLASKGYNKSNPLRFDLWYTPSHYGDAEVDLAAILREQLQATGVMKVNVKTAEWASYYENWTKKVMPAYLLGFYPDYMDPDNNLSLFGGTEGSKAVGVFYSNKEWDDAFAKALSTTDPNVRRPIYEDIQNEWTDQAITIPIYQGNLFLFMRQNISGEIFQPSGGLLYHGLTRK